MRRGARAARLRTRLIAGQIALVVAALTVTWAVTAALGPPLFRRALSDDLPGTGDVAERAERAFQLVNLVEVLIAVGVAFVLAAAVSPLVSRRIAADVGRLSVAAADIARGDHHVRVAAGGVSRELDEIVAVFNDMAARLERTEQTRRRLLGDLAHEMRTPLATLQAYLQAIDDGVEPADGRTLGLLAEQVTRLERLARDLHAVSSADEHGLDLAPEEVDLAELSRRVSAPLRPDLAARGVELRTAAEEPVPVVVDPDRIGQVLTNALGNAARHTPAGGTVSVTARVDRSGAAAVAELEVLDTGEGVAAEHLPFVFERFYRAHPPDRYRSGDEAGLGGGSGIGLTISRSIVVAHGGTVTLHSEGPGRGSRVVVRLPLAARATA